MKKKSQQSNCDEEISNVFCLFVQFVKLKFGIEMFQFFFDLLQKLMVANQIEEGV